MIKGVVRCVSLLLCLLFLFSCGSKPTREATTPRPSGTGAVTESARPLTDSDFSIEGISVLTSSLKDVTSRFGHWSSTTYLNGVGARFYQYSKLGMHVVTAAQSEQIIDVYLQIPSTLQTPRGIHIGSSRDDVLKEYGQPNATVSSDTELVYQSGADRSLQILFRIESNNVTQIGIGWPPLVSVLPPMQ